MTQDNTANVDSAPLHRVVGPFFLLHATDAPFPEAEKLVLVEPSLGRPFFATFTTVGDVIPWPHWIVSEVYYRRADPMDRWAYYERPNTVMEQLEKSPVVLTPRPIADDKTNPT